MTIVTSGQGGHPEWKVLPDGRTYRWDHVGQAWKGQSWLGAVALHKAIDALDPDQAFEAMRQGLKLLPGRWAYTVFTDVPSVQAVSAALAERLHDCRPLSDDPTETCLICSEQRIRAVVFLDGDLQGMAVDGLDLGAQALAVAAEFARPTTTARVSAPLHLQHEKVLDLNDRDLLVTEIQELMSYRDWSLAALITAKLERYACLSSYLKDESSVHNLCPDF